MYAANMAGDTPLSLACANGHLNIVKYLVNDHHHDPRSMFTFSKNVHSYPGTDVWWLKIYYYS